MAFYETLCGLLLVGDCIEGDWIGEGNGKMRE